MPKKIVINRRHGGFHLSREAIQLYKKKTSIPEIDRDWHYLDIARDDPALIETIEELGLIESANPTFCKLKIVEIPDDVAASGWDIMDYDGMEWVAERHRVWA